MEFQVPAAVLTAVILMLIFSTADSTIVRLVDSDDQCSGTPEVLYRGEWRRVHSDKYFDYTNAKVVCRELDCGNAVNVTFSKNDTIWEDNETKTAVQCAGKESSISQCKQHSIAYSTDIITDIICSDSVRLVDGAGLCSGRVEVKTHQSWTTVCETDFDWQDAEVVCRELGCGTPLTLQGALYGEGKHPFGTKEFHCKGTEKSLLTCSTSTRGEHICLDGNAVGLTCSEPGDVRLVDGKSHCSGTVEMFYYGEWRRVYVLAYPEAAVVCRQLGCGFVVVIIDRNRRRSGSDDIMIDCNGSENALEECSISLVYAVMNSGVICSDLLEQPIISFSTPIRVTRGLQGSNVFRGHSFTITCSTQPQYPGGSFHLKLPWTNRSHTQTAVNHSASFLFPAADDSHQGNYSCVYENQVTLQSESFSLQNEWISGNFTHNFSSESECLSLTVTDSPLPAVITRILLVLFLLLISCLLIFLIFKKCGHIFIRNTSDQHGAAAATVQYENIELVSLQQNLERGSGEELPTDLEKEIQ